MAAYCYFDVLKILDEDKMAEYKEKALAIVNKYSGRYIVIGGQIDPIEGDFKPVCPVIIEFPTLVHAHRWYNSKEYSKLKKLRLSAAISDAVFMQGI